MNRAGEDTDVWHDRLEVFRMLSIGVYVPAAARATTPAREAEFLSSTSRQLASGRVFIMRNVLAARSASRFVLGTRWMQAWPQGSIEKPVRAITRSGTPSRSGRVTRRILRFGVKVHREGY